MYTSAMFVNTPQAVTSFALSYTKPQTKAKKAEAAKRVLEDPLDVLERTPCFTEKGAA